MVDMNFLYVALAALIPLVTGFIWYSKPLFANAWMRTAGVNEEQLKKGNFAITLLLTYVLSFMLCIALTPIVIHQMGAYSTLAEKLQAKDAVTEAYFKDFMANYGTNFRTFKHGVFHGVLSAIFFALPVIGIIALFERKKFKYVAIHVGYWMLTLGLMGGVICAFV